MTIAAWPIGTTQTRIGEAGEGTKQNQIEGEEQREQGELSHALRHFGMAMLEPNPGERSQGQHQGQQEQLEQGRYIEQINVIHGVIVRVGPMKPLHATTAPNHVALWVLVLG